MAKSQTVGSNTPKNRALRLLVTLFIVALTVFMLIPFIWMVSSSFKYEKDVMATPFKLFPSYWYTENYKRVLNLGDYKSYTNYHFLLSYWNSIKVAVCSTVVAVVSATMAGYAFAKMKFKGKDVIFMIFLSQMMIPSQLTLIPRFVMFKEMGLFNTHWALILPKIVAVSSCFMMRQAFLGAPEELRESAKIDGAGEMRTFMQIMIPLVKPTVAAISTVQFLGSWNAYQDPLIFFSDWKLWTIPLALDQFAGIEVTQYNLSMTACTLATIPVFIVFLSGQKFFMKGLTVGAVKG